MDGDDPISRFNGKNSLPVMRSKAFGLHVATNELQFPITVASDVASYIARCSDIGPSRRTDRFQQLLTVGIPGKITAVKQQIRAVGQTL